MNNTIKYQFDSLSRYRKPFKDGNAKWQQIYTLPETLGYPQNSFISNAFLLIFAIWDQFGVDKIDLGCCVLVYWLTGDPWPPTFSCTIETNGSMSRASFL